MRMMLASVALAAVISALAASAGDVLARGYGAAQEAVTIGVDADPTGNEATSLGPIDACVSVDTGDTSQVDVFITDVTDLLAWETYLVYDVSVVNVVSRDVMMFQAANAGSEVFDVSEGLPDIDGQYGVAAVDLAMPPAPDSGSGVLARLTLRAVGPGVSLLSLSPIDVNEDGRPDLGPTLTDVEGEQISDRDADGFYDGPISNAQIAVDRVCPSGTPVATPTPASASPSPAGTATPAGETPAVSPTPETPAATETATGTAGPASPTPEGPTLEEDEESAWTSVPAVIGYVVGGLGALVLASIGLVIIRRGRTR